MSVILNLTLTDVPIRTLNDHTHWRTRQQHAKQARTTVGWLAKAQKVTFDGPVNIRITLLAPDMRRRDPDGIAGAAKPIIDGLVDAGWIKDDGWRHVSQVAFSTFPASEVNQEPGWVVTVTPSKALYAVDGGAA